LPRASRHATIELYIGGDVKELWDEVYEDADEECNFRAGAARRAVPGASDADARRRSVLFFVRCLWHASSVQRCARIHAWHGLDINLITTSRTHADSVKVKAKVRPAQSCDCSNGKC